VHRRSDRIIFLIGAFKLVKCVALVAVGIGLLAMARNSDLAAAIHAIRPSGRLVDELLAKVLDVPPRHLAVIGIGSLVYAVVFAIEGVGLVRRRRWAEYMTTIITTSFIPIEIYEMIERGSLLKLGVILVNIAIVIYLIVRLREERKDDATPRSRRTPASSDVAPA
jgi:uncharacterized membrane protein (DUF2068 family)